MRPELECHFVQSLEMDGASWTSKGSQTVAKIRIGL